MLMMKCCAGKVGVPKQLVVKRDASSIPDAVTKAGLTLPLGIHLLCIFSLLIYLLLVHMLEAMVVFEMDF